MGKVGGGYSLLGGGGYNGKDPQFLLINIRASQRILQTVKKYMIFY